MIERVVKSALEKALDAEEYISSQPLNFQLYYANKDGRAETINTVYLEDGNPKLDLYLEVFNESDERITFTGSSVGKLSTVQAGGNSAASAQKCHFSLRWEKDLQIKPSEISVEQKDKWQVNYDEDDHFFTLYFLHKSGFILSPQNQVNDKISLTLKDFTANNSTVKSSNVEMLYGSPLLLQDEQEFTENLSIKNAISITNHPDKKNIPLQVRFIGPNTILNDGSTPNNLKLQIVNRPLSNNNRPNLLLDKTNSKFIVSFETGDSAEALTISDKANTQANTQANNQANKNQVSITSTDTNTWKVDKTQNAPEWTVKLNNSSTKDKLVSKEAIELEITNIVTSNPSGVAYLYITYQNIPNYPDGQLVVPIEKTPLLYRVVTQDKKEEEYAFINRKVGIGITTPSLNAAPKIHLAIGDNHTGLNQEEDRQLAIYTDNKERVRINRSGNVGIGTTNPSAKLHVNGGDAIVSGKVGIGTENPSAKLHVQGGDAIVSGKVGIGTENPSAKLHVQDGNAIVSGNVGIGTENPSAKLHVQDGNAIVSGNVGIGITTPTDKLHIQHGDLRIDSGSIKSWGTIAFYPNTDKTSGEDLIKVMKSDGQNAAMLVNHQGNVGIGTTNPSAKLDVNGSVKLGDGSTAWNLIICGKVVINYDNVSQSRVFGKGIKSCSRVLEPGMPSGSSIFRPGRFKITFEKPVDSEKLVVIVTPQDKDRDNIINIENVSNDGFTIQVKDSFSREHENSSFHFIAIELAENYCQFLIT